MNVADIYRIFVKNISNVKINKKIEKKRHFRASTTNKRKEKAYLPSHKTKKNTFKKHGMSRQSFKKNASLFSDLFY